MPENGDPLVKEKLEFIIPYKFRSKVRKVLMENFKVSEIMLIEDNETKNDDKENEKSFGKRID